MSSCQQLLDKCEHKLKHFGDLKSACRGRCFNNQGLQFDLIMFYFHLKSNDSFMSISPDSAAFTIRCCARNTADIHPSESNFVQFSLIMQYIYCKTMPLTVLLKSMHSLYSLILVHSVWALLESITAVMGKEGKQASGRSPVLQSNVSETKTIKNHFS